jgi:hypothetical protein
MGCEKFLSFQSIEIVPAATGGKLKRSKSGNAAEIILSTISKRS